MSGPRLVVLDALLVVLVGIGWGLLAPATKALFAADSVIFDGTSVAAARAVWTLPVWIVVLGVAWRIDPPRLDPRRWLAVVAAGLAFGPGITWLFSVAAAHTSVAHISFLVGVSPVTNAAAAAIVFRAPLSARDRWALGLGIAGVSLLAFTRGGGQPTALGDTLMIVWLAGFAFYACLLRYVGARINAAMLMALVMLVAMSSLIALTAGGTGLRAVAHVADSPGTAWWFFGEIVLGSTLVAQTAYAVVVRRRGVALATIGAEYVALAVGIAASIAAHEPWTWLTVAAGAILCAALAVTFAPLPPWLRREERVRDAA